jgi:membrane protein DedA with SNARE-associated domain
MASGNFSYQGAMKMDWLWTFLIAAAAAFVGVWGYFSFGNYIPTV